MSRKTIVTFLSPGTFVGEQSCRDIASPDPALAVEMSRKIIERYGARPYGFYFSTVLVSNPVPDGEGGTLEVVPKEVDRTGIYFIGGTIRTFDAVERAAKPDERILLDNMRWNEFKIVVENTNSYRSVHPFGERDVIIDDKGAIVRRGDDPELVAYRKRKIAEHQAKRATAI